MAKKKDTKSEETEKKKATPKPKAKKKAPKKPKLPRGEGLKVYWAVYRLAKKELSPRRQWTKGELKKYIKDNIYPAFKGGPLSEVTEDSVRKIVDNFFTSPDVDFANPLVFAPLDLLGINWFDIDSYLIDKLKNTIAFPKNVRFEVDAGRYGTTQITDFTEYEYGTSGVQNIVESIRAAIDAESMEYPEWVGEVKLMDGRNDDGKPDSYFVQFTLYEGLNQVPPNRPATDAQAKAPTQSAQERKKQRQDALKRSKDIIEKVRKARREKSARLRKRPDQKVAPKADLEYKKIQDAIDAKKLEALKFQQEELQQLRKDYDDGIYNAKEYKAERQKIINRYTAMIEKFKKGGVV